MRFFKISYDSYDHVSSVILKCAFRDDLDEIWLFQQVVWLAISP